MSYLGEGPGVNELPEMMKECPVCLERLFDDNGIACNGEVAKIMCFHLVHDDCLRRAAQSLNADGHRFGIGGFGPRAGCPVCNRPVSFWSADKEAAAFPIFWMNKILHALNVLGDIISFGDMGRRKPVSLALLREFIERRLLTDTEKKHFNGGAFNQALEDGSKFVVWEQTEGRGEKMYCKKMAWCFDQQNMTLWLYKWGDPPAPAPNAVTEGSHFSMTQEEVEREEEDRAMREELERRNMKVLMEMRQEEEEREREKAERKAAKRKQRLLQQQRLQKQSVNGDRSWVDSKWLIIIGIVIVAVAASIYFDNGEAITW